jgi:hypothetical protein
MDFLYGCDWSDLYSDEGPPIGDVAPMPLALHVKQRLWLLRWN